MHMRGLPLTVFAMQLTVFAQFVAGVPFEQLPRLGLVRLVASEELPYDEEEDAAVRYPPTLSPPPFSMHDARC